MRLKSKRIQDLMEKEGITEEMLPAICNVHCIQGDPIVGPCRASMLARILGVEVSEIAEEIKL